MSPLRKYLLYSTIFGLFTNRFMMSVGPIHLLYFYAVMLINLSILASLGSLWIPRRLLGFLGYLFASGMIGLVIGSGSVPGFVKDFTGILPSALYFAAFYRYMRFDVKECFAVYARVGFYMAVFGIFYMPFQSWGAGRLMSLCLEPSSYCIVSVPAAFYYLDQFQRERRGGFRLLVLFIAIMLSRSSLGYMGLLLGVYLFGRRYAYGKVLAPAIVVLLGMLTYNYSELFRVRVADAITGSTANDVSETNISTFGLLANYYVTRAAFANNPIVGGGLGSYITSHQRYLESIPGIDLVLEEDRINLGQWDASSLLLRVTAEFGLVGLCAACWFLWQYWPRGASAEECAISMAVLCYLFMKLLRDGSYFNPEVFFFFGSYAVLGAVARARKQAEVAAHTSLRLPSHISPEGRAA